MSAHCDHFDDVKLLRRQNSLRRKILNRDNVAVFGQDDDSSVAR